MCTAFYGDGDTARFGETAARPDADEHRSAFQIDRDRVVFSFSFRRLQSKTQVFQPGEYDFYRTRLTHSLEVARIARSLCDHFRAARSGPYREATSAGIDTDLVEAVGLSHDLGHPPFGHIGERKLNELMAPYGGFEGNAQTLRILTRLIWEQRDGPQGMQPTRAFLDGVLKYKALYGEAFTSEGKPPAHHFLYDDQSAERAFVWYGENRAGSPPDVAALNGDRSLECQIMDWADDAAYCLHDLVDGARAGFLDAAALERWAEDLEPGAFPPQLLNERVGWLSQRLREERLERSFAKRVSCFIKNTTLTPRKHPLAERTARYAWQLEVAPELLAEAALYKRLARDLIFRSTLLQQLEFKGGHILSELFAAIAEHYLRANPRPLRILPREVEAGLRRVETQQLGETQAETAKARLICDFLAGCTDGYAVRLHKRLFSPDYGSITDLA